MSSKILRTGIFPSHTAGLNEPDTNKDLNMSKKLNSIDRPNKKWLGKPKIGFRTSGFLYMPIDSGARKIKNRTPHSALT
jgi:hypothetical protein